MALRSGPMSRLLLPGRTLIQRFAYLFLLLGAVGLMLVGKADVVLVERARTAVIDATAPILDFLSRPAAKVAAAIEDVRQLWDLRQEVDRLRQENERLLRWQQAARQLESENAQLRELMNVVPEPGVRFVTARVIADAGGAFVRSLLVNAGGRDGVRKGQIAMTAQGMVGRVAEVGDRQARVLLVTDLNSRIPVMLESSRERAMLSGDNAERPRLQYLGTNARVEVGDRIVTSGHGGAFPPGLPIGLVASASDWEVRVQPYVDMSRLEYIRLVDFQLDGILLEADRSLARSPGRR
ncbi:MAG: rod shape-determining protein MreC [Alphaproteobacteria bacterium]|nr:rod shape-determining protein MreC [Alphaproteobacteria bacterium]